MKHSNASNCRAAERGPDRLERSLGWFERDVVNQFNPAVRRFTMQRNRACQGGKVIPAEFLERGIEGAARSAPIDHAANKFPGGSFVGLSN